ncbi:MAG: ATP-dependent helicase, partial [Bacteroidaceae bacterium]|nr:ATP-dependent helicase [Bacteroidaceae bacterium]
MNEAEELFDELMQYHRAQFTTKQRYSRLYNLLDRMCKDLTKDYAAEYTSLFARLCAVCVQKQYPQRASIELFRHNAVRVRKGEYAADEKDYRYDLKALCDFISFFYQTPVPEGIRKLLPNHWRAFPQQSPKKSTFKRVRFVVDSWDEDRIYGHAEDFPTKTKQLVNYHIGTDIFKDLPQQLYGGAQVNLLDTSVEENNESVVFHPSIIVLEPDYLIDVTALTECLETYGATAYNYLVKKFIPNPSTRHILLGNAANQFLDDLVNENEDQPITWEESITLNFRDFLLDYCICSDVDNTFFQDTKEQFNNIRQTIAERFQTATVDINRSNALLEPSFFCECLGLQGRIDLMLNDFSRIIELKSGKCEEFNGPPRGKMQHSLQMALYKEILH